jgi:putative ABC transport system substrate-binding protein
MKRHSTLIKRSHLSARGPASTVIFSAADWGLLIMKRREFLTILGSLAVWPGPVYAQQPALPVVGFLTSLGRNDRPNLRDGFRRGLSESGYIEGHNVGIEYRFAENRPESLSALAADLVSRKVAVIAATGGGNAILAAKAATTTIPIVFTFGGDPVRGGFVGSLSRPGSNITGVTFFNNQMTGKRLSLLHELVPNAAVIGMLVNPKIPESIPELSGARAAARMRGWRLFVLNASTPSEIDNAFATLRQQHVGALLVGGDPYFTARRHQIVALAARDAIPTMYFNRNFVTEGGLIGYGNDIVDAYRRAGVYVGRILKGEQASDLPVDRATKFELLINLKTAKSLGLKVPEMLLVRADKVIE